MQHNQNSLCNTRPPDLKYFLGTQKKHLSRSILYQTKKRNAPHHFPVKLSFEYKNVNCHEILISDQIILILECGIDEYLYLPCVRTTRGMLLSTWNSEYALQLQSMKMICWCYVRQPMLFRYDKIHFHQSQPFKLIKRMLKLIHLSLGLTPTWNRYPKGSPKKGDS